MLNPHYIVGFVDGEGCFSITVNRRLNRSVEVRLKFEIEVREDDEPILREIQKVLDCGAIYRLEYQRYKKWRPHVKYQVGSFKDIKEKVIPFFIKYPLQAKKRLQFELFVQVSQIIETKNHLTQDGIDLILDLRNKFRQRKDSLDALDAHVQWGVE